MEPQAPPTAALADEDAETPSGGPASSPASASGPRNLVGRLNRDARLAITGCSATVVVATLLFVRWGIHGQLNRDESIYSYGGQQLAHGVPPYSSIFDPKAPLASMLAGAAAAVARLFSVYDVYVIRLAYLVFSLLAVVGVFLLARHIWRSTLAGVVGGVVFASFTGFAADALDGPDAKTPGVAAITFAMWLAARRQWLLSGLASGIAFMVWQPFVFIPVILALVALLTTEREQRLRAFGRAAIGSLAPVIATSIYFIAVGAFGRFVESAFRFPLTGVVRPHETVFHRMDRIVGVVHRGYGFSGALLWLGMATLLAVAIVRVARGRARWRAELSQPVIAVVVLTMLSQIAYACTDFQSVPDVLPALPYGAVGVAGLAALLLTAARTEPARRAVTAGVVALSLVFAGVTWIWFGNDPGNNNVLRRQQAGACALQRILGPSGRLLSLGNPAPLVLTHRRNPDRYIYLGSGVADWKISHTRGGLAGWEAQIQAEAPDVVVVDAWGSTEPTKPELMRWLRHNGYHRRYIGGWRSFLTTSALAAARSKGVALSIEPAPYATGPKGHMLPAGGCH